MPKHASAHFADVNLVLLAGDFSLGACKVADLVGEFDKLGRLAA